MNQKYVLNLLWSQKHFIIILILLYREGQRGQITTV